jgi:uncharacterized protein YyaL (SSP411 family)
MNANPTSPARQACPLSRTVVCAIVLLSLSRPAHAEGVRWRQDYAAALKEAAQKGAPLLVNVGTADCYWCKQLDARTFVDEEIIRLLADRVVPLKLDASSSANAYLVNALRVQSYPTLVFASPDGAILGYREGFLDAAGMKEQLNRAIVAVAVPDWMRRDFDEAGKRIAAGDHAKAISLLKGVVEDGKSRPLQVRARKLLEEFEKQATERAGKARELAEQGKTTEATQALEQLEKVYPGTLAARQGKELLGQLTSRASDRPRRAAELLRQAREDYKDRHYLCALDRCEELAERFADLPEAAEAEKLAAEIKDNPEWSKKAADQLADRLCLLYLSLAESLLQKGEPQQAVHYLERVRKMFPGTRHAEQAQSRLARLRGAPGAERK